MSDSEFSIEAGDILIVQGKSSMSKLLVAAQKPFYLKNIASHILISIADGFYIHSTGDEGVHIVSFPELLPQIENNWIAIRLKGLTPEQKDNLVRAVNHHRGQKYNKKYFLPVADASFCSELGAKIYKRADISILNDLSPQYVKPSNFLKVLDKGEDWEDITDKTKESFEKLKQHPIDYSLIDQIYKNIASLVDRRRSRDKLIEDMILKDEHGIFTNDFKEKFKELKQNLADKVEVPYWDDTFKKDK